MAVLRRGGFGVAVEELLAEVGGGTEGGFLGFDVSSSLVVVVFLVVVFASQFHG